MPNFDKMKKQTRSGGGPFNMGSYGAGKSPIDMKSPMQDRGHDPERPEGHKHNTEDPAYMLGQMNDDGNKVVDEKGNWAAIGDRSDLVNKREEESTDESTNE